MVFIDTETVGLMGPIVLIQYQYSEGNIELYYPWREPVKRTLTLIENFCNETVVAFNLSFDWFQLTKFYNVLREISNKSKPPDPDEFAFRLSQKPVYWCLKPKDAIDVFLVSRKSEYQSLMDRRSIKIRKVPVEIAIHLKEILKKKILFDDIFFTKRPMGYQWEMEIDGSFADLVCKFGASGGLKPLCGHIFHTGSTNTAAFDIQKLHPVEEHSYDPYSISFLSVLQHHINYWEGSEQARTYATNDIILLRRLCEYFNCQPDYDARLAVSVGAARYRGFAVDIPAVEKRYKQQLALSKIAPTSPQGARRYILKKCTPVEEGILRDTKSSTLERLKNNERVRDVIAARKAEKEVTILHRLLQVQRFCPDFRVIGAKSGRMSGGSGLSTGGSINPQGINRNPEFRKLFTLADRGYTLSGGDFDSFEVTIADAAYNDSGLHKDLLTGKSLHGIFGSILYDEDYDEIMLSKSSQDNRYNPSKNAVFAMFYGATEKRIAETAGITEDQAKLSYKEFVKRYPGVGKARASVFDKFCSMRQPAGIGTEIIYTEPADYIETLLGYRRYFTLENRVVKGLFELAQNPPKDLNFPGLVVRRDREQTQLGATQSALYAAAFNLQAQNMRAAANHVIQGTGAEICKRLQDHLWNLQPIGANPWKIQLLNVHDEVLAVHDPMYSDLIKEAAMDVIEIYRSTVPLIGMTWKIGLKDWSQK